MSSPTGAASRPRSPKPCHVLPRKFLPRCQPKIASRRHSKPLAIPGCFASLRLFIVLSSVMARTLKTAPELERYILNELRNCAACKSVTAVTVALAGRPDSNWEVAHLNALGGTVPNVCVEICD